MSVPHSRPEMLSFLAAVKEAPDDDTPRLILADWLDEHDDPERAAYNAYLAKLNSEVKGHGRWHGLR